MTKKEYGVKTMKAVRDLYEKGIDRMAVIIRHSARMYNLKDIRSENIMGLTEKGKELSYKFGRELPPGCTVRLFSSPVGRCIETAYLIDKGYTSMGGETSINKVYNSLLSFFVRDTDSVMKKIYEGGASGYITFIRDWLDGKIAPEIMLDSEDSSGRVINFLVKRLNETAENHINICVSHDMVLFTLKEHALGLRHEDVGIPEYLEGVIIYNDNNEIYITSPQTEPQKLKLKE